MRNPIPRMMVKGRSAGRAYDEGARGIQDALVQLLQEKGATGAPNVHMNSMRGDLSRMAGSDAALLALKSVPAVGVLAGLGMKDEEESFANQAMDLLGMGLGAYGIHRGINRLGGTTPAGAESYHRQCFTWCSAIGLVLDLVAAAVDLGMGRSFKV